MKNVSSILTLVFVLAYVIACGKEETKSPTANSVKSSSRVAGAGNGPGAPGDTTGGGSGFCNIIPLGFGDRNGDGVVNSCDVCPNLLACQPRNDLVPLR